MREKRSGKRGVEVLALVCVILSSVKFAVENLIHFKKWTIEESLPRIMIYLWLYNFFRLDVCF